MIIKDSLKKLFKCHNKNKNQGILALFREVNNDVFNLPVDKYTKKYTKIFEKLRTNISLLSKEMKDVEYAETDEVFQTFKKLKFLGETKFTGDVGIKYDLTYNLIEKYRNELKK